MREELKKIYDNECINIHQVYDVFKEYYGEENVDLQNCPNFSSIYKSMEGKKSEDIFRSYEMKEGMRNNVFVELPIKEEYLQSFKGLVQRLCERPYILIHWDRIEIKNEMDECEIIYNLYAKVTINITGNILCKFHLSKATYTKDQYCAGYVHSHMPTQYASDLGNWDQPCTGSGPINGTISLLYVDNDLDIWRLFCLELDKYVQTESLEGGPYIRISQIRNGNMYELNYENCSFPPYVDSSAEATLEAFTKYFLKTNKFEFFYINNSYHLNIKLYDFIILYGTKFLEYVGKIQTLTPFVDQAAKLQSWFSNGVLYNVFPQNNKFLRGSRSKNSIQSFSEERLFTFKGTDVKTSIIEEEEERENETIKQITIVLPNYVSYVYYKINYLINIKYDGKEKTGYIESICQ